MFMTQHGYAKHRGVSRRAVQKAIESGRIRTEPDYHKAHAIRVMYEAKLAKLEVSVRDGKLVDLEEVNRITFNRARRLRDRLMSIPRRLAPQVAAESDLETIRSMIHTAVIDALEDLASVETTQPLRTRA